MSERRGCEVGGARAGIGSVIAGIPTNIAPTCHPSAPIAVVSTQGTADPLMPFGGGEEGSGSQNKLGVGGSIQSAAATQELWGSLEGCNTAPAVTHLPVKVSDSTSVTRRAYSGCKAGTDVTWYEIQGGGHRVPPQPEPGP